MVQQGWWDSALSFDAAMSKAFSAVVATPESVDAEDEAFSANRKAMAIPDSLQAHLGLLDQTIMTSMGFSKAGWSWPFACGAGLSIIILPVYLQLSSNYEDRVVEVSRYRRRKEKKA